MKSILKYFLYLILFIATLIVFFPKENLYYYAVETLSKNQVEIQTKKIEDKGYALTCDQLEVYFQKIKVAKVEQLDFRTFGVITKGTLLDIGFDKSLERFFPKKITETIVSYTILDPLNITIEALLEKGTVKGKFNLLDQKLHMIITVPKGFLLRYKEAKKYLKKIEEKTTKTEDVYIYEYKL